MRKLGQLSYPCSIYHRLKDHFFTLRTQKTLPQREAPMDQVIISREPCGCPSDTVNIGAIEELCSKHQQEAMELMLTVQPEPVKILEVTRNEEQEVTQVIPSEPETIPSLGGTKFDQGKSPISMIPRVALEHEAQVFAYGANKYGKNNYKNGMKWSRLIDAALRHLLAYADREEKDQESLLSHLAHARANLAMLELYADKNLGEDDR